MIWPSAGAGPLQLSRLSDQTSLTADDPQFVLVGGSQVNGPGGDGWAQVARVGDVQVGQHCRTESIDNNVGNLANNQNEKLFTFGPR